MTLANETTSSPSAPGLMEGVRVLDLTRQIAGPYCTKLMATYGADVIKIEQPGVGDPIRHLPPFYKDQPDPEGSLHFLYLNTSKRSITLDLKTERGKQIFLDLAKTADVVVENFRPGVMDEFGIGWETLHALNPHLVLTSISNFGQTGPYRDLRASDLTEYAMSGAMTISGREDLSPLKHGLSQGQYDGGVYAAWVTSMMLFWQAQGRTGQWIDVSIRDVIASSLVLNEPFYAWMGGIQGRRTPVGDGTGNGMGDIMPCADGYVIVQYRNGEPWENVAALLDSTELLDPMFSTNELRMVTGEALYEAMRDGLKDKKKDDLFNKGAELRVLIGIAQDPKDLLACPHLNARGYWVDVDHPKTGKMKYPGAPIGVPGLAYTLTAAPTLGQHTEEVLGELGINSAEVASLRTQNVI